MSMAARRVSRIAWGVLALAWAVGLGAGRAEEALDPAAETRLRAAFPGAERIGPAQGEPRVYPVYRGPQQVGFVFFSKDVAPTAGYSARPLNVAIGLGLDAIVKGAQLVEHHEPILIIGVREEALARFVGQYAGIDLRQRVRLRPLAGADDRAVDGISGATVSSLSLNDAILGAARRVARAHGLLRPAGAWGPRLDLDRFEPEDWPALLTRGSIARLTLRSGDVDQAFRRAGEAVAPTPGATPESVFIDLYAALATPAQIGRNLLGAAAHERLMSDLEPGGQLLFIAAQGLYSYKGTGFVRSGVFERVQIAQGGRTIRLLRDRHHRLDRLAVAGAPELREMGLFVLPAAEGFDPLAPWRLELLVSRPREGSGEALASFSLPYQLPARHVIAAAPSPAEIDSATPLWRQIWEARADRVAVLVVLLAALSAILVFQDLIAQRPILWRRLRLGAAAVTLVWLGWYAGGQLSVVNVLTFASALLSKFEWEFFLLDPLIFMLWCYVAVALLFWGRGVFCGWLCPFGALQELVNRLGRALRVPQLDIPFALHERLWPIKYILFLMLFALSLGTMASAVTFAEVEPFKTAISLRLLRGWEWLLYPAALLAVGLSVERFFCRYLCPLGAALAIPARLRMFEWLKRRHQCGRECNICATRCPVQAIHPDGRINPNECIHCLRCQTLYFDDQTCPPLIARRHRREDRAALRARARPERSSAAETTP